MKFNKLLVSLLVVTMISFVACKRNDASAPDMPKVQDTTVVVPSILDSVPEITSDTISVLQAVKLCKTMKDGATTDKEYYVKGYVISSDKYDVKVQYKNATFHMADATTETNLDNAFLVYRAKYLENSDITQDGQVAVGDYVVVKTKLQNYKGNTPESVTGAYIYQHNDAKSSGSQTSAVEFYCFRVKLGAVTAEAAQALKAGDKVVISAKLVNYKGNTPETVGNESEFVNINGEIPADAITAEEALNIAKALPADGTTDQTYTIAGEVTKIVTAFSTQYNNISFNIKNIE